MKTLFRNIAILTILLTTITACDEVEDLLDVEKDVTLTEYFTVDLDGGDDTIETENLSISILTKAIEPYKDKLKKVKIQKVTFKIVDYKVTPAKMGGKSEAAPAEFEVQLLADGTLFMNESFVGTEAYKNGTLFEITDSAGLNSLATKLLNNDNVTVALRAEGKYLEGSTYFRVETKFYIEVTANPL